MEDFENQDIFAEEENSVPTQETEVHEFLVPAPEEAEPARAIEAAEIAETGEEPEIPVAESTYRGVGAGRKESPYADSPYVMHHAPRQAAAPNPGRESIQAPAGKKPKQKKRGFHRKFLAAVLVLLVVAGSCAATAHVVSAQWERRALQMEQNFNQQLAGLQSQIGQLTHQSLGISVSGSNSEDGLTAGQIYARNVDSVVLVECSVTSNIYGQTATGISAGTGFIISEDGYVVTNYHVVQGSSAVAITLVSGEKYEARVVGYDSTNDVAVLKVEASGLNPVELGSSTDLIVGDQVVAIGNPLGELTSTLTVGYVSAKERDVATDGSIINMLQTDCAINSGNSGGPLFNMKGEVVGITTAKYSGESSSGATIEGIGFAIPIDDLVEGIGEIIEFGYIKSAYMGVVVQNMDAQSAELYSLPMGAYVISVEEGFAAARAGIQPKDIITQVGGTTVSSLTDLTRALRNYEPGDTTEIVIYRSGEYLKLLITLDERPRDQDVVVTTPETEMPEGNFEDWYNFFAPYFGYGNGNGD